MELFSEANKNEVKIYELLKTIIDPELSINIIDLGLIYDISYNEENGIIINLTLSSEGCPMGEVIIEDVKNILTKNYPDIKNSVNLVWEPKWNTTFITPAGKESLNKN